MKNLFKKEINVHIFVVSMFLFLYLIAGLLIKSGFDYANIIKTKIVVEKPKFEEYSYQVFVNGDKKTLKFNEPKSLDSILKDREDLSLEFRNYIGGVKVHSIQGNENFKIVINNQEVQNEFIDVNFQFTDESQIYIFY
jgi:hypothetical protein